MTDDGVGVRKSRLFANVRETWQHQEHVRLSKQRASLALALFPPSHDGNHRVFSFKNKPSLVFNPNHLLMRAPKAYSQRLVSCMYMHI
jgi:hypothetical protein